MLLGGGVLSLAAALRAYERTRQRIDPAFPEERPPVAAGRASRAVDVLLIGVDDTEEADDPAAAGMVALLHLAGDGRTVQVVAIPPPTVVPVSGYRGLTIGGGLAQGGVPLVAQAAEHLLGLRLNHVSVLPLTGLAALTDALGGVVVDNGTAFTSDGVQFPVGRQRLDGERTVAFVRSTGRGHAGRMDAEGAYLTGLVDLLLGRDRPIEREAVRAVAAGVFPRLATDPGLDGAAVARLAVRFRGLRAEDVHIRRLPVRDAAIAEGGPALVPDAAALEVLRRALGDDVRRRADRSPTPRSGDRG